MRVMEINARSLNSRAALRGRRQWIFALVLRRGFLLEDGFELLQTCFLLFKRHRPGWKIPIREGPSDAAALSAEQEQHAIHADDRSIRRIPALELGDLENHAFRGTAAQTFWNHGVYGCRSCTTPARTAARARKQALALEYDQCGCRMFGYGIKRRGIHCVRATDPGVQGSRNDITTRIAARPLWFVTPAEAGVQALKMRSMPRSLSAPARHNELFTPCTRQSRPQDYPHAIKSAP